MKKFCGLISLLRPKQAHKSLVVFSVPVMSGEIILWETSSWISAFQIALNFLLASMGIYAVNDIADLTEDLLHPVKKRRPLPMDIITVHDALILGVSLILISLVASHYYTPKILPILVIYVSISLSYTFWLKKIAIVEMVAVASGFFLRAASGEFLVKDKPSIWFYLVLAFGSLSLITGKRIAEKQMDENIQRQVVREYSDAFLQNILLLFITSIIICYSVYLSIESERYSGTFEKALLYLTLPVVLVISLKILGLAMKGALQKPEEIFYRSKDIAVGCVVFFTLFALRMQL